MWHIGRHQDIGYERYLVLNENNLHEAKVYVGSCYASWRKMKMIKQPLNGQIQNRCMILQEILIINFGGRHLRKTNKTLEEKTMSKTEVALVSDIYSFKELKQLIIDFPIKVNGWVVKENKVIVICITKRHLF